jgi:Glycosyl transferase family 2
MTLLVHDEADILRDQIAFHLAAGVDFVVATDHRSTDGTTEILEAYEREGLLRLIREDAREIRQSEWVTRMARLAATEHGAAWVINSDADEFWWPRGGSLRELFAAVPPKVGAVRAVVRPFVPRAGTTWFAERMTARLVLGAAINDPGSAFRHVAKTAHRAHPEVVVEQGNHVVSGVDLPLLPSWFPIELFHFPLRSVRQFERRLRTRWPGSLRGDLARARAAFEGGGADALLARVALDDDAVSRGLADGLLATDVRLRDALRRLRAGAQRLEPEPPTTSGDVAVAIEGATFADAHAVRLQRRTDELRARVAVAERRRATSYGSARG